MTALIEVSDSRTWPQPILALVKRIVVDTNKEIEYSDELDDADADRLVELLQGERVRAYHATRLFPHEVESIRTTGLRLLTPELFTTKLYEARELGYLTVDEHALLLKEAINGYRQHGDGRGHRVCLAVGSAAYDDMPGGVRDLLSLWGGELIYRAYGRTTPTYARLSQLGRASIVVSDIELPEPMLPRSGYERRNLLMAFVACQLGRPDAWIEIHYPYAIAGSEVYAIWHPGDAGYDAFRLLPQS